MRSLIILLLAATPSFALIGVTAPADLTYQVVGNSTTITITADPNAATTTATLDGAPFPVGVATVVNSPSYHELIAESRNAGGGLVNSVLRRFIITAADRFDTENGIPPHTPYNSVNDAPSAFAGGTLKMIAPAAWPIGFPVPMAAKLVNGANETLRLNGNVTFGGFPGTALKLRRGWGSVNAPAQTAAGTLNVNAFVNGLTHNPAIAIQAMAFTDVSGAIASNTTWPANSQMRVTSTLTVNAGATLTIGAGTIVLLSTGTATNGSAAEISVSGTLQINGTETNPVVFAPATPGLNWGGIELPAATSMVNANWTIFTGAGEDENWTANSSIDGPSHQSEQPVFAIAGSGAGTSIGAQLHLNDCFSFEHAGQQMNSRTRTWIDLHRTLYQKCITSGEMNGSKITIDRSALIEFPSETGVFDNDDNDAIYFTNGDLSVTNSVIGFTKDDGVDSGGDGGTSPFGTVNPANGNTITRYDSTNNWYEGTYHEGNSLSGTRYVYFTGCVFLNCGQGIEAGYSAGSGGTPADGPNAIVDGCLFVSNMVAMRWGDNYRMTYYNGTADVKNSILINSLYRDTFSYNWQENLVNSWTYQTTEPVAPFRPYFVIHDNLVSQFDAVHHPVNTQWNPANPAHAAQLNNFMPVPGSNVGVGVSTYAAPQQDTSEFPGVFTVRLSTFSSKEVSVDWAVIGKIDPFAPAGSTLGGGTLIFAPGQTLQTISIPIASPANYGLIHVALRNPVNAEVTGEKIYVRITGQSPTLIAYGSNWKYLDNGSDQGTGWRSIGFNDSSWSSGAGEFGYGDGDEITRVEDNPTPGYTAADMNRYATTYFRKVFNVSDVSQITGLTLTMRYDDGGVVYINGMRRAATTGMPVDPAFNYYLGGTAPPDNSILTVTNIPVSALSNGPNTIAVEMHQQSAGSSDMSFDLQLIATLAPGPLKLNITSSASEPVLWWDSPGDILERSIDLLNWLPFPAAGSPVFVAPDDPKEFFRLRRSP